MCSKRIFAGSGSLTHALRIPPSWERRQPRPGSRGSALGGPTWMSEKMESGSHWKDGGKQQQTKNHWLVHLEN